MHNEFAKRMRLENAAKCVQKNGERLYHYTSFLALNGIIVNKELWFGNAATMNDKSELTKFLQDLKTAALIDYPEKRNDITQLFEKIEQKIDQNYPYEMCCSRLMDNAAQWERYADNAKGVCIIFNTNKLSQLFYYAQGLVNEVFYEYDIRDHQHYKLLCGYLSSQEYKGFDSEKSWFDNILKTATLYKHSSFISESECRIVIFPQICQTNRNNHIFHIEYKPIHDQIKKMLIIKLDELCESEELNIEALFDGLVIGPRSTQNADVLKSFCRDNGFNRLADNIIYSNCPLR